MSETNTALALMEQETTSINVTGVPIRLMAEIRELASKETRGVNSKACVRLLQEALEARKAKTPSAKKGK